MKKSTPKKGATRKRRLANPANAEHFKKLDRLAARACKTGKPTPPMEERAVHPYPDPVQKPVVYELQTREYHMPFNYRNFVHKVHMSDPANAGLELGSVNSAYRKMDGGTKDDLPADCLEITEKNPIVRVVVIGSACTPPGYVQIEADVCEGFDRPDTVEGVLPTRFRIDGLWGMHLRGDQWMKPSDSPGDPLPESFVRNWPYNASRDFRDRYVMTGVTYNNFPLAGMSCAIFEIPAANTVRVLGGCAQPGWTEDKSPNDNHYAFRIIRTAVIVSSRIER